MPDALFEEAPDTSTGHDRIWNDSAKGHQVLDADPVAHSPEAMKILMEQGVARTRRS